MHKVFKNFGGKRFVYCNYLSKKKKKLNKSTTVKKNKNKKQKQKQKLSQLEKYL